MTQMRASYFLLMPLFFVIFANEKMTIVCENDLSNN